MIVAREENLPRSYKKVQEIAHSRRVGKCDEWGRGRVKRQRCKGRMGNTESAIKRCSIIIVVFAIRGDRCNQRKLYESLESSRADQLHCAVRPANCV